MEPRIQYAKTEDGVSIAYWTLGEGPPLVQTSLDFGLSHIQLEWQNPMARRWYERLAETRMVVRYDHRGNGLSDREVNDYSLDALVLDLEAVVDRLNLERFGLVGSWSCGVVAIGYAAKHPERVSHLILWCSATRFSDLWEPKQMRALEALLDVDWETATETWARVVSPESELPQAHLAAAFVRESITPKAVHGIIDANRDVDVDPLLPRLESPTLVACRRQFPNLDTVQLARGLASRIQDARLTVLEGASGAPLEGDTDAVLESFNEFLSEGEETGISAEGLSADIVHTILFTDIEGSTALTQRLGDARARDILRGHERITREALKSHGGSEIKTLGDGFMASFSSATKALDCAIAIQRAFEEHNQHADEPINVRIGLNAGEPIAEDDDLFGASVNRAARIAAMAQGAEILVANVVRELAEGKGFMFGDRGETALRGFEDPVRLYEVRWQEDG